MPSMIAVKGSQSREPTASYAEPQSATSGEEVPAKWQFLASNVMHQKRWFLHGKEKVYGSIP
jgi:hypothetical protein